MNRRRRIYEGKAKVLYEGPEPGTLIQHFKDDATAFNAEKHALILRPLASKSARSFRCTSSSPASSKSAPLNFFGIGCDFIARFA